MLIYPLEWKSASTRGGGINEEKVDGDVVGGGKGEIDYMHMHLVDKCAQWSWLDELIYKVELINHQA